MFRYLHIRKSNISVLGLLLVSAVILTSCAAIFTSIRYRKLRVETNVESSIFVTPVINKYRTVYVRVRNQTAVNAFDLQAYTVKSIQAAGYKVVNDPTKAEFILQANVRVLQQITVGPSASQTGGESIIGGVGGAMAGSALTHGSAGGALVGGVLGMLGTAAIDSASQVNVFGAVVDVRLSQKIPIMSQKLKVYQTRINTIAYKAGLTLKTAKQPMVEGISKAIGNFF